MYYNKNKVIQDQIIEKFPNEWVQINKCLNMFKNGRPDLKFYILFDEKKERFEIVTEWYKKIANTQHWINSKKVYMT